MTGVFKQKNPGNILVLFILAVLLKIPLIFYTTGAAVTAADGYLYRELLPYLNNGQAYFPLLFSWLTFGIIMLQAYLLVIFINNNRLMPRANYLAGMAYVLLTSLINEMQQFSALLVASLLFLIIFMHFYKLYTLKPAFGIIFNSGILSGIAVFIYFPAIFFLVWMMAALAILRTFKLNEWLLLLAGVITPAYFIGIFLFVTDGFILQDFYTPLSFTVPYIKPDAWLAGALGLMLLPFITGIFYINHLSAKMIIQVRKAWWLFFIYFVTIIVMNFFDKDFSLKNVAACLIPVAAFHGYGFLKEKFKWYSLVVFWASVILIIAYQVYGK